MGLSQPITMTTRAGQSLSLQQGGRLATATIGVPSQSLILTSPTNTFIPCLTFKHMSNKAIGIVCWDT